MIHAADARPIAAIILAAGKGTRMRSSLPKVLHQVARRPLLHHALASAQSVTPERLITVVGTQAETVRLSAAAFAPGSVSVVQDPQLGTAHAVMQAMDPLQGFDGDVLVLFADTPLISTDTLRALQAEMSYGHAVCVVGFTPEDAGGYGRLIRDGDGNLKAIVEAREASPAEREVTLCNSGLMGIRADILRDYLPKIGNDNSKGEYYLTDLVALTRAAGHSCGVIEAAADEVLGVNSRADLALAEAAAQDVLRGKALAEGATLIDPASTYFSADTVLGRDVIVEPCVVFGPGVKVADRATIRAFSHLEQTEIAEDAVVGPFARLRPGTKVGQRARVGNFVEIKKAVLEEGAKVNHLTYIGDAHIGAAANIGAGTITCNYDGFEKHHTKIGSGAFIGSNTALVAPVTVGDGAIVGAGSVITKDVPPNALGVTRAAQTDRPGWAEAFRKRKNSAS